jgi:SAM-dependent methyltransferase
MYVQYGAGLQDVQGWANYDASPTLRIQRIRLLKVISNRFLKCKFASQIMYGDIVKGLPHAEQSVDGVYCSHVLEHLSFDDFQIALNNTYKILKKGGRFRLIVPNLEFYIKSYHRDPSQNLTLESTAAYRFNSETCFGRKDSRNSILSRVKEAFGNSYHQWMWDEISMELALQNAGFVGIKKFQENECDDKKFLAPERNYQFANNAIALECFRA